VSRRLAIAIVGFALACASMQAGAQAQPQRAQPTQAAAPAARREPTIDATFKAWDADHNGVLSQAEFRQGWNSIRQRAEDRVEASLHGQFDKVDANHNAAIDASEYGNLLLVQRAGKSAPALASFDRNGDQRLEFDEYMALVARMAAAPHTAQERAAQERAAQGKTP